jgi:hypothetical protein
MVGVAGKGFTVTDVELLAGELHPEEFVTITVYIPAVFAKID